MADDNSNQNKATETDAVAPEFLRIRSSPVYFQESWETGIGGGLWSTGLAMGKYLQKAHALQQLDRLFAKNKKRPMNLLELGSGNGLLAACWLALGGGDRIGNLVVTDMSNHLPLIERTMQANLHLARSTSVHILEHEWGIFPETSALERLASRDGFFDIIVGSDVAYRPSLYEPLVVSLQHFTGQQTVILLGCTMSDTTPEFFDLLRDQGFIYQRLADSLLEPEYRGKTFGLFVVQRG